MDPCNDKRSEVAGITAAVEILKPLRRFEAQLRPLHEAARMLPALTARGGAGSRDRLCADLAAGRPVEPIWEDLEVPSVQPALRRLDHLRREGERLPLHGLYGPRLAEMELELCMLGDLGKPRAVRPLALRRYGDGSQRVRWGEVSRSVASVARGLLSRVQADIEPAVVSARPASSKLDGKPSMTSLVDACSLEIGLSIEVKVDARLVAGAAAGERTMFVADRDFGAREAARLCVHEVLGHLTAAANGRAQPLRILEWGTAGSFTHQEGMCLALEDAFGYLDGSRLRTLAARVLAVDAMHSGATFTEVARALFQDHGFPAFAAVAMAERAFRGGGVARDVCYLVGFIAVLNGLRSSQLGVDGLRGGRLQLNALRSGRLSLAALEMASELKAAGLLRPPTYRPNLSRSFFSTRLGTSPFSLPPNEAASLINEELT